VTSPPYPISVPDPSDVDAFLEGIYRAFGWAPDEEVRAGLVAGLEPERLQVARDGAEIVGTTCAYSLRMTVPGGGVQPDRGRDDGERLAAAPAARGPDEPHAPTARGARRRRGGRRGAVGERPGHLRPLRLRARGLATGLHRRHPGVGVRPARPRAARRWRRAACARRSSWRRDRRGSRWVQPCTALPAATPTSWPPARSRCRTSPR